MSIRVINNNTVIKGHSLLKSMPPTSNDTRKTHSPQQQNNRKKKNLKRNTALSMNVGVDLALMAP